MATVTLESLLGPTVEAAHPQPRQFASSSAVVGTSVVMTFSRAPLQTSILFAYVALVVQDATVSSITQTNVTWTKLRSFRNGTSTDIELWKGVPSGTPGTTATANFSASVNGSAGAVEWPAAAGLAGTVDQPADNSGSSAEQNTGTITQTVAKNLTFALFCVSNGSTPLTTKGPYPFTEDQPSGGGFSTFAWLWGGVGSLRARVPSQANAAWANMIVSII